tara:strand:+ start:254 stop:655 length:402 start_codon:yes stop_codon:yes gene_type:complete
MIKKAFIAGITLLLIVGFVACDNTPGPGTAEVKVIDNAGLTQTGINVRLFCTEPECVVIREGKTNELGIYTESFDLPVVLRVRAVRYDTTITKEGLPPNEIRRVSVDSLCGEGFIQVENDEIAAEIITILQCR